MKPQVFFVFCLAILTAAPALAVTTSLGQEWNYEPDAWARGTTADSAWFGWDVLDGSGVFLSHGQVLDDTTPDLGTATPSSRLYQGTDGVADPSPTTYGHRSGSGNYYTGHPSGPGSNNAVDDTITGVAPSSGTGGHTTILLQAIGQPQSSAAGIEWTAPGWTKTSDLYGQEANGTGVYWQEWTAPGNDLPFSVNLDGPEGSSSYALDAFQVDTFWTDGAEPIISSRTMIGIPEPSSLVLTVLGLFALAGLRRR